jgi:hypothetical protein
VAAAAAAGDGAAVEYDGFFGTVDSGVL